MKLLTALLFVLVLTLSASAQEIKIERTGNSTTITIGHRIMQTRTITVNETPNEGETLSINAGQFVFSDQQLEPSDAVQISRNGNIADNIAARVNQRPIGCTASSDGSVVTLTSDDAIDIVYDGEALEVSP